MTDKFTLCKLHNNWYSDYCRWCEASTEQGAENARLKRDMNAWYEAAMRSWAAMGMSYDMLPSDLPHAVENTCHSLELAVEEITRLRQSVFDHENDCAVLPEDYSVTEYVTRLRAELEAARDQLDYWKSCNLYPTTYREAVEQLKESADQLETARGGWHDLRNLRA